MSPGEKMIYAASFTRLVCDGKRPADAAALAYFVVKGFREAEHVFETWTSRGEDVEMYKAMRYGS